MRSLLFVPGDSERKLAKSLDAGADALLIDLEDSVAPANKEQGRRHAAKLLRASRRPHSGPKLWVRINALTTRLWEADIDAVMSAAPDGVMLPKVRNGGDVHQLSVALDLAEARGGLPQGSTPVIAIATEVPAALFAMVSFVGCSNRLEGLAWGAEDLSATIGAVTSRGLQGRLTSPFRLARDLTLFAAAAAGVSAIDEIHADFRDHEGLAVERQMRLATALAARWRSTPISSHHQPRVHAFRSRDRRRPRYRLALRRSAR